MLITRYEDFILAVLSGSGFMLDGAGALHTDRGENRVHVAAEALLALSSERRETPALSRQRLRQAMISLLGSSGLVPPSFWNTLPSVRPGMTSREIAAELTSCLLRAQEGPAIDCGNPVISGLLVRAVDELPTPAAFNKDLLRCCAAETLAREPRPVRSDLDIYRRLVRRCVLNLYDGIQCPLKLVVSSGGLNPDHPVIAGAVRYFVDRRAASPEFAERFGTHFREQLRILPVNPQKSLQETLEEQALRTERAIERGGTVPSLRTGTSFIHLPCRPETPPAHPPLRPETPPAPRSCRPETPPAHPPLRPESPPVPRSPRPEAPQPSGRGRRKRSRQQRSSLMSSRHLPRILPRPEAEPPVTRNPCPEAEPPFARILPRPEAEPPVTRNLPCPEAELRIVQSLPRPEILVPLPVSIKLVLPECFFQPAGMEMLTPEMCRIVLEVASLWRKNLPFSLVRGLELLLMLRLMNAAPGELTGEVYARLNLWRDALETEMPSGPEVDCLAAEQLIRQRSVHLLVRSVRSAHPSLDEEDLSVYAGKVWQEAILPEKTAAGTLRTVYSKLEYIVARLENPCLLALPDGCVDVADSIVEQLLEFRVHKSCEQKDLDGGMVRGLVRRLLGMTVARRVERPLTAAVKKYSGAVVQALEDVKQENPGGILAQYDILRRVHAGWILPVARYRHPGRSDELLWSTVFCLLVYSVPVYEKRSLDKIQSRVLSGLGKALKILENPAQAILPGGRLRPSHPGVRGILLYGLRMTKLNWAPWSIPSIMLYLEDLLRYLPADEMRPSLPEYMKNICGKISRILDRQRGMSPGKTPEVLYTAHVVRLLGLMEEESLPVTPLVAEAMAHAAASAFRPGMNFGDLRKLLEEIHAVQNAPQQVAGTDGLFNCGHPGVAAAVECVAQELHNESGDIALGPCWRALSELMKATPVTAAEATLPATVRKHADAVAAVLRGRGELLYRREKFPGTGDPGAYIVRGLSESYQQNIRNKNRDLNNIHPGFYTTCGFGKFVRNAVEYTFASSRHGLLPSEYLRMCRLLRRLQCSPGLHYFLSMVGSGDGLERMAEKLLTPGEVDLPVFAGFAAMMADKRAFRQVHEINWDNRGSPRLKMLHTYHMGVIVKNQITKKDQKVCTAVLKFGIQIHLDQKVEAGSLPAFQALDITLEPFEES